MRWARPVCVGIAGSTLHGAVRLRTFFLMELIEALTPLAVTVSDGCINWTSARAHFHRTD